MITVSQQIEEIEEVLRKTPHHKATNGFIGAMRAKIARLKDKDMESSSKGGAGGGGYNIKKQGDASIVLIGPPSCGKSTLLNKITNAESKVAAYPFTTVSVIPGMLKINDAYIQILDIPGLIEGASIGKGRGKEVISVSRSADLLIIMTDVGREDYFNKLTFELEKAGIRINKTKPSVLIEKKLEGGIEIHTNFKQEFDSDTVKKVANEFGIKNAIITLKDKITLDQLVDSFSKRITYKKALYVVNKSDLKHTISNDYIYISCEKNVSIDLLISEIWKSLEFIKVYLVNTFDKPNLDNPLIMKKGDTLQDVIKKLSTEVMTNYNMAKIWGNGSQFPGQTVPLTKEVEEGMQIKFIP